MSTIPVLPEPSSSCADPPTKERKWPSNKKPRKGSWMPVFLGIEDHRTDEDRARLREALEREIARKAKP